MSESKYVIHDVIETSHRSSQRRSPKSVNTFFRELLRKFLIFLGSIILSAAIGNFAVHLPDSVPKQKDASGIEGLSNMSSDVNNFSGDQK